MGNSATKQADLPAVATVNAASEEKPKCKPCCACPETKKARDQCVMEKGQENCSALIEAHKECMRKMGFNIN